MSVASPGWPGSVAQSGGLYEYDNIQPEQHAALIGAGSAGAHFHRKIKSQPGKHPFHHMTVK